MESKTDIPSYRSFYNEKKWYFTQDEYGIEKDFAKMHVVKALVAAARQIKSIDVNNELIDKILDCYPLENIK